MTVKDFFDLLHASAQNEISNNFFQTDNSVDIELPNGKTAVVTAREIAKPIITDFNRFVTERVSKHDYGNIGENKPQKLLLENLQDVKAYIADVVCSNVIGAQVLNGILFTLQDNTSLE